MSLELHYKAWHQLCLNPSFHILWRGEREREMSAVRPPSVQSSHISWQECQGMAVLPSLDPWSKENWGTILPAICWLWCLLGWRMAMEMCFLSLLVWQGVSLSSLTTGSCWFTWQFPFHFLPVGALSVMERNAAVNLKDRVGWGLKECSLLLKFCLFCFG